MKYLLSFTRRANPIGLDISGRWIKAAQTCRARSGPHQLLASARLVRADAGVPFSAADADLVAGALERLGFEGHRVVLMAPRELLYTDVLELPPRASGAPLEHLARMELARANRCDPGSFELGTWDIPTAGRAGGASEPSHVFAVGLAHERADPIVSALEAAGLEVVAIDTPGCAIARACLPSGTPDAASLTAILEVGWNSALLIVVWAGAGGVVVYERSIVESGLSRLFGAVKTRLSVDDSAVDLLLTGGLEATNAGRAHTAVPGHTGAAHPLLTEARGCITEYLESLVPEVQRSLSYTAHRYQGMALTRLMVTGDGAELVGLCERLGPAVAVPVARVRPADVLGVPAGNSPGHAHAAAGASSLLGAAGASLHLGKGPAASGAHRAHRRAAA